jgi:hypothetical protein
MRLAESHKHSQKVLRRRERKRRQAERYRRRRVNLLHKIVDLYDIFGIRSYTMLQDDKNTWELNTDPDAPDWPPTGPRTVCISVICRGLVPRVGVSKVRAKIP